MKKYNLKTMKAAALKEAALLKAHATDSEKSNLNVEKLVADNRHRCIYGQMTGDCFSQRAADLLGLCAKPFSSGLDFNPPKNSIFKMLPLGLGRDYSALEFYIAHFKEGTCEVVAFIKGETETLIIEDL